MMMNSLGKDQQLTRIGVFYDGNYFLHVSNFYCYNHERRSRISISGLHHFLRNQVAMEEGTDVRSCQIVDAHYFRGRLNANEALTRGNLLYYDRIFDDILMAEGVTTHYLPVKTSQAGYRQEKGIDVWLALEAFELAFYKRFNVVVLIAADGDYVPLIRKLNSLGTRVMVLSWDFEYTTIDGHKMITRTSQELLEEVTYPIAMHEIIENRVRKNEPLINNLFVPPKERVERKPIIVRGPGSVQSSEEDEPDETIHEHEDWQDGDEEIFTSEILSIKSGYGFIRFNPGNLFFHYTNVRGVDFNDLRPGDRVSFSLSQNDRGDNVAVNVRLVEAVF
jgi:cold shock CspA family protein/uncharacterized LabA/DUF88 family protein